jgi:Gas vesicle synthesis protein GvpL/GvpF
VRILPAGGLEAWVSTFTDRDLRRTVGAVREHDAVVSAALATGRTPLPARFGQTWPSDLACAASVTQRASELESLLRSFAGLVEMTVCTLLPGMPPAPRVAARPGDKPGPGTAYLAQLRARADRARRLRTALEGLRARLDRALGSVSRGAVAEIRGSDEALALSVAYLVQRADESHFRGIVGQVSHEVAARLVVAGPRAPYSFAPGPHRTGREESTQLVDRR